MKLWLLLGLASLLVAFTQAAPLHDVEEDGYILDLIGINIDQVKAILKELAEHGKQAAIQLAKKLIQEASGLVKDLLVKVLEWLENRSDDAYILDLIGINIEEVKAILKVLAEYGKQAAVELAKKILEHASGALKSLIQKVLDFLQGSSLEVVDEQSIIDRIMETLKEQGTDAAKKLIQDLMAGAQGIMKDLLMKLMEKIIILEIEGKLGINKSPLILDKIGINIEQVKAILKELAEHGKQAAIQLAKKLIQEASGIIKDLLVKVLEWLENRGDEAYILDIIGINIDQIKAILKELAEHGKQAAIQLAKKLLEHASGILKDLLVKLLEFLQNRNF